MDLTGGAGSKLVRQRIAHYEILERLGEGGMGVVFKARDTRLDRLVALKTLRAETVEDTDHRSRLIREAKSASALNHPNIVHIYEAASEDGCDYIAMEYVAGTPLSHLIARRGLPWQDALRYAVQIADAVDAAHGAGIVHRDLKPGNVMITERGLVKVLDFGLAKVLAEHHSPEESERNVTMTMTTQTPIGFTAGTPAYMSPEQISAEALDARSDIFSFGVMLYQMIAGALPFRGESRALVMASVLRDEPLPPGVSCPDLPPEVERIVMRCLRKDKAKRFQHIVDVKLALEDLLESPTRTGSGLALPAVRDPRRTKSRVWMFAAAGAVAMAVLGFAGWKWFHREPGPVVDSAPKRLTSDGGLTTEPSISPDGKLLAFSSDRSGEGRMDIWVKQIGGGEPIRLTHDPVNATQPDFSPDGTQIVFHSDREAGGLYLVSTLGGNERKIADHGLAPHFSPDGKRISWWDGGASFERGARMFVMDMMSGAKLELKTGLAAASWPVWSDDGKELLFRGQPTLSTYRWFIVPARGGTPVPVQIVPVPWPNTEHLYPHVWRRGQVIFTAESTENASDGIYIANLSPDGRIGAARRLTPGITAEVDPSLANDGTLVFASLAHNLSVYSQPITRNGRNAGPLERLTRALGNDQYPSVSADGTRVAFQSARSGEPRIWMKDLTKGTETAAGEPVASDTVPHLNPAGTLVAWSEPGGKGVLAEPFPGGPVRRLCDDCRYIAGWSQDGRRFLYTDYSAHSFAGVFDIASGRKVVLRHPRFSLLPRSFSPDGGWIAAIAERGGGLLIAPVPEDGVVNDSEWISISTGSDLYGWPTWSADGKLLYFTSDRDGFWCIWAQTLGERTKRPIGSAFPVEHFHGALRMRQRSARISLSRDKIVFSLEEQSGNVWKTYLDLRSKANPSR